VSTFTPFLFKFVTLKDGRQSQFRKEQMVSNVRVSMGVGVLVGLTLSVLLMLMATAPAQAHTLTECQAQITS
jgi:hypothetical protein